MPWTGMSSLFMPPTLTLPSRPASGFSGCVNSTKQRGALVSTNRGLASPCTVARCLQDCLLCTFSTRCPDKPSHLSLATRHAERVCPSDTNKSPRSSRPRVRVARGRQVLPWEWNVSKCLEMSICWFQATRNLERLGIWATYGCTPCAGGRRELVGDEGAGAGMKCKEKLGSVEWLILAE